ncbi:MAG TPA: hypothetical protein DEP25_03055 [Candidatus Taylorbacteria bacterium]|nr:MAG: TrpR like protein, YerC/YecD [Parcubacteria group bacterium GW2011_GWF2_50_9]HCB35594.1 hypothetical protein [Candidatus Taylorbacteria bacterium]
MPRSKPQHMSLQERNKLLEEFWITLALLKNKNSIRNFLKDLLSETEAVMLARRLKIAELIHAGWSYDKIERKMHTSPATIASVHAWLDGGFGGYLESIMKLKEWKRERDRRGGADTKN